MGKIQIMPVELSNKISAGEVVERPSNIVKELVENSIDAGSKNISIYLKCGGIEEIKVLDDGSGMDKDDVLLSFMPHATSKIKNEYDLFRIKTLGFRGEAIASIAAVSNMEIISSTDGKNGFRCLYKSGKKAEEGPAPLNKGTKITVSNLFINTPARLKFLKDDKSELSSILFYIEKIAISNPNIKISLYNDDKIVFQTSGRDDIKMLIGEIYGYEKSRNLLIFDDVTNGAKYHFVLLDTKFYRSNKLEITLIVNGRYVKNFNIINSIIKGFEHRVPIGKYPIAILYITIDPLLIDCNIHPTKIDIKIANEAEICNFISNRILNELIKSENKFNESDVVASKPIHDTKYEKISLFSNNNLNEDIQYNKNNSSFNLNLENLDEKIEIDEHNEINKQVKKEEYREIDEKNVNKKIPNMNFVGEIFGTYLIFQNNDGMYLVDQHAAHERINYEYYFDILTNQNQPKCDLLIPIKLELTKRESLYVSNHLDDFNKIGFEIDSLGETLFAIRSVPLWAKFDNFDLIAYDVIAKMIENDKISISTYRDSIAKMIACKASIKANHVISKIEVEELMKNLNKCKNPYNCPHGRPVIIKLSVYDIEKMFERIQSK